MSKFLGLLFILKNSRSFNILSVKLLELIPINFSIKGLTLNNQSPLYLGVDVGSTTCKLIVVEAESKNIIWQQYERHHTKQAEKIVELLEAAGEEIPEIKNPGTKIFITGSGSCWSGGINPIAAR